MGGHPGHDAFASRHDGPPAEDDRLALAVRAVLAVDPLRRGVHDRLAGTIVVRG